MKQMILVLSLIWATTSSAEVCSPEQTQVKVLKAAITIEKINGGGLPLTKEIVSYSSQANTWAIFLSYSGRQSIWKIVTSNDGCQIISISK